MGAEENNDRISALASFFGAGTTGAEAEKSRSKRPFPAGGAGAGATTGATMGGEGVARAGRETEERGICAEAEEEEEGGPAKRSMAPPLRGRVAVGGAGLEEATGAGTEEVGRALGTS